MMRSEVNQGLLDLFQQPSYLEIGVDHGETFHAIKAFHKVAVDPHFGFDLIAAKDNSANSNCVYHEVTSDAYFSKIHKENERFDVIFIDGLHTFDQTLKDLMSAILLSKESGVVVVDDVIPASYPASISNPNDFLEYLSATGSSDGTWMGDVYKVAFFVREYLPLFNYATVRENHGQMVMWRGKRPTAGEPIVKVEAISRLEYRDVVTRKNDFQLTPFSDIIATVKDSLNDVSNKQDGVRTAAP